METTQETAAPTKWHQALMQIAYTTFANVDQAKEICQQVIEKKIAACANLIENGTSFFYWDGKVQHEPEVYVLFKTKDENIELLRDFILREHPYECPCFWAVKADGVSSEFESWIKQTTS